MEPLESQQDSRYPVHGKHLEDLKHGLQQRSSRDQLPPTKLDNGQDNRYPQVIVSCCPSRYACTKGKRMMKLGFWPRTKYVKFRLATQTKPNSLDSKARRSTNFSLHEEARSTGSALSCYGATVSQLRPCAAPAATEYEHPSVNG